MKCNGLINLRWLFCIATVVLRKYKHFFSMFCICFHFIELFYKFFSEIHTKTIHFLYNSWWTHQERRNFDCWNRRKSELAKRWECDKKSFNHDRFIGNCKVNNLVKGSESKHVDGGTWVTYGKRVDFPPLPMCSGSLFPCLPFLCVLLPYLRHFPDHSHSFLALELCFSTSPRYKTLANIPCCQQCHVQAPSSPLEAERKRKADCGQ